MLWTTNTDAFYWWHFECTEIPWWDPEVTSITSYCSMIKHGPMLQGSVHNSWKLKTSQFLHGQHTHRACHPLSMFGMLWIGVYDSVFQFLPISSKFAQPLNRSVPTFHNSMRRRCVALREANGGHTRYWLVLPQYSKTAHFRVAFYCGQPKTHQCNAEIIHPPHMCGISPVRWMDYLGKGEVLTKLSS